MKRTSRCPEINERRLRARLEGEINQACKEGLITDGKIFNVDCSHPHGDSAHFALKPSKGGETLPAAMRLFEAGSRE